MRLLVLLALTACSQPCPTPSPIPVKEWSKGEQLLILAEEKKLSPDSILMPVLMDYAKLRREVR